MSLDKNMMPLTFKELDYIVDCISNEDLLVKQYAASAGLVTDPAMQQQLLELMRKHERHIDTLMESLKSHQNLAPAQTH